MVLEGYWTGVPVSRLPHLEESYSIKYNRSLDYTSLGVSNIEELLIKMGDRVAWFVVRGSKEKSVMSASEAKNRRRLRLKPEVKELLNSHRGEIEFSIFENLYEDQFKHKMRYKFYGLTDLDHLCKVFKDDILEMGVANRSGEKVIKALNGINLRKRKCQLSEPGPGLKKIAPSKCK